jgi:hypothetical protein
MTLVLRNMLLQRWREGVDNRSSSSVPIASCPFTGSIAELSFGRGIVSIVASFVLPDILAPVAQSQAQLVINVLRLVLTECPRLQGATVINVAPRARVTSRLYRLFECTLSRATEL